MPKFAWTLPLQAPVGDHYFEAVQCVRGLDRLYFENRLALCPVCAAKYQHARITTDDDLRLAVLRFEAEGVPAICLDVELAAVDRLTTKLAPVEEMLRSVVGDRADIEILSYSEPVRMLEVDGFNQKVVRFTTDIPHLPNWGTPLLLGPGSILVAHTKDEFVLKKDLEDAVGLYVNLVRKLLNEKRSAE